MKKKPTGIFLCFLLFLVFFITAAEKPGEFDETGSIILENATLYLPDGTYQANSFVVIEGCKIQATGLMKERGEKIYDHCYNLEGQYVYPGFIDPLYMGFQEKVKEKEERNKDTKDLFDLGDKDREHREPYQERNLFIKKRVIDSLEIKISTTRKIAARGFTLLHVVPNKGVINGTSAVVSPVSENIDETIIIPEKFMFIPFRTNSQQYPTTHAGLIAELKQLREDCFYHQKMKKLQFYHPTEREKYIPELDILLPYFTKEKKFLIATKNLVEQRMVEILSKELHIQPVMVASPDVWRRETLAGQDIILPLSFKPAMISRYSKMGDQVEKDAKANLYPKKLAAFFKQHPGIALAPPGDGDYGTLYDNIRILIKHGVTEAAIIKALTQNTARILGISRFVGAIQPGYLANLVISDKKIFEEKIKISKVFIEGKIFNFTTRSGGGKPPVADLTGTWKVKISSPMGEYDSRLIIEQEGNDLTGSLTNPRSGKMTYIEEGFISGDEIFFTFAIDMGSRQMTLEVSGKVKDKRIKGTISIGPFGEGSFTAVPEVF